jgi:hypothetical protein
LDGAVTRVSGDKHREALLKKVRRWGRVAGAAKNCQLIYMVERDCAISGKFREP